MKNDEMLQDCSSDLNITDHILIKLLQTGILLDLDRSGPNNIQVPVAGSKSLYIDFFYIKLGNAFVFQLFLFKNNNLCTSCLKQSLNMLSFLKSNGPLFTFYRVTLCNHE